MSEKTLNLNNFFSTTNQREGLWYEPQVNGDGCGFELKLTGLESDENAYNSEIYDKEYNEALKIENAAERSEKIRRVVAKRVASFVKGIRGVGNTKLKLDGKDVEYSDTLIANLMYECLPIQKDVFAFVTDAANFMNRKKKN